MVQNINERKADVEASLDIDPVDIGSNSTASGADSMAVGVNASALADGSIALGDDSTVDVANAAGVGDRDILITNGRKAIFPADQGTQELVNLPITDNAPEGEDHYILFSVADETALEIQAEADGLGGVQNLALNIPGDLDVGSGAVSAGDITGDSVTIEDSNGNSVVVLDGDTANTALQLFGNNIEGVSTITPDGTALQVDGDLTISGELTEGATF